MGERKRFEGRVGSSKDSWGQKKMKLHTTHIIILALGSRVRARKGKYL